VKVPSPDQPLSGGTARVVAGRYQLLQEIGEGGTAKVFRALDTVLHVERAVKLMSPAFFTSEQLQRRFLAEARTMARLDHPNIVRVVDFGSGDDGTYIVMEYVSGGNVQQWTTRNGPMPARLASQIAQPVLEALAVAHADGVVHRDVKPHNILITRRGRPKLTDFGIAHLADAGHNTRTGVSMGTLAYMSPEQHRSARQADARSDLYSLGATILALVTGNDPTHLFVSEIRHSMLALLPEPLRGVVDRASRYEREERWASAEEMLEQLRAAHDALPALPPDTPSLLSTEEPIATLRPEPAPLPPTPAASTGPGWPVTQGDWFGETATPAESSAPAASTVSEDIPSATPTPKRSRRWLIALVLLLLGVGLISRFSADPVPDSAHASSDPKRPGSSPPPETSSEESAAPESAPREDAPSETAPPEDAAPDDTPTEDAAPVTTTAPSVKAPRAAPVSRDVVINSVPWSEITIDGAAQGRTVWKGTLTTGPHVVTMTTTDGEVATRSITVLDEGKNRFCWDFALEGPCPR